VIGYMAQTLWETAWCIRTMEELMMEMMDDDENAVCLLDRITEVSIARAELYAKAGADIVHLGDDIGTQHGAMMGLEMWREWLKPRLKRVIDAAKAINPDVLISYHSCGDIRIFLEDLVDVGIEVLNPIQPECMDFQEVYDRIGDRMSFWGTIGTQKVLPFGTPEEVRAEVIKERAAELRRLSDELAANYARGFIGRTLPRHTLPNSVQFKNGARYTRVDSFGLPLLFNAPTRSPCLPTQ